MKRIIWLLAAAVVTTVAATITTSCKKDVFSAEETKQALEVTFHNDTVDANHTWTLLKDVGMLVTVNTLDAERIELLTANPYTSDKAEVVAAAEVGDDEQVYLKGSLPLICDSVYIAAVDAGGQYTVVARPAKDGTADFSTLNTPNTGTLTTPSRQTVYYCFCNSFPQPSTTWGFNDLVLSIQKTVMSDRVLRLRVTLEAVGTTAKTAAALRLDNVRYDEVDSVTIVSGAGFVRNQSLQRTIIKDDAPLLRGMDGMAVINLFDDAHAAFNSTIGATGEVTYCRYNVSHNNGGSDRERAPVTVTFDVHCKGNQVVNAVSFGRLDPFIVYFYNSNLWEVHKYPYKFNQTLVSYLGDEPKNYDNGYTWALEVPYTWFRYPLTGQSMGSYKKGALYGAYQTVGHSFGEWGAHRVKAQDWYLYPNVNMVF